MKLRLEVARAVRAAAESITGHTAAAPVSVSHPARALPAVRDQATPRSSNLRLAKEFSECDRDAFRLEAFEYITRFFESSLEELAARNPGTETGFRSVDANRFTAAVYRNGKAEARCTIFLGGGPFQTAGIAYVNGETDESNAFNEQLTVHSNDQAMFLQPMGMAFHGGERDTNLSFEGAAEFLWTIFIGPLQ